MSEELIERLCRACRDGYIEREAEEVLRLNTVMQPCDQLPRLRDELAAERQTVATLRAELAACLTVKEPLLTAYENVVRDNANLRAELAAERGKWFGKVSAPLAKKAIKQRNEARAAVTKLREALEPFAVVYKHDIGNDEADEDWFRPMTKNNRAPRLTVGHLQRAYAAWFETGGGDE